MYMARMGQETFFEFSPCSKIRPSIATDPYLLRCLLMAFVIWNISNRVFPKTGFSLSSAMISLRFFGSCSLCFLM